MRRVGKRGSTNPAQDKKGMSDKLGFKLSWVYLTAKPVFFLRHYMLST